jgi:tRNA U34 5-methylaminomethyl-2-thiouridine-forming methyltransferase MnmC
MANEIIITEDGSHSMISEIYGVSYHSHRGSVQETKTVFINAGLEYFEKKKNLRVFEMGFGTGLNAIMTAIYAHKNKISIEYDGIEAFPVTLDQALSLNFSSVLPDWNECDKLFQDLHQYNIASSEYFKGNVIHDRLENFQTTSHYDVIFYDAFAPATQDELWSTEMMKKMYHMLFPSGILVTYCAKGQFKRNLREAGFEVEALPGPPGKREMTRGKKNGQ